MQTSIRVNQASWRDQLAPSSKLLLRWGWFVVLSIIVTTAFSILIPDIPAVDSYQATLVVQINLPPELTGPVDVNDTTTFFSQLFVSPDTLSLVLPKHPELQLSDLLSFVTATPVTDTNIVQLTASDFTEKDAGKLVTDIYQALVQNVSNKRSKVLDGLYQALNFELKQSEDDLVNTTSQIQNLVSIHQQLSSQYRQLYSLSNEQQQRIKTINQLLLNVEQQKLGRSDILSLGSSTPIITTAPGDGPTQNQRIALAPLVGLIMGLGGSLLAMRSSNTLPLRGKKREIVLPHITAIIPRLPKMGKNRLEALEEVSSQVTLQLLRSLRYQAPEYKERLKVITVTSPLRREGKSTIATCLAIAAAQSGQRTLLVDANPHRPILHRWFKLPDCPGTLDTIHAFAVNSVPPAPCATSIADLGLLSIGNLDQQGAQGTLEDPLRVDGLRPFIERACQREDLIIFDCSSLLAHASAANLVMLSDSVLLVVDAQKSRSRKVLEAGSLLSTMKVPFTIVLNRAKPETVE